MAIRLIELFPDGILCANEEGKTVIANCSKADAGIAEEKAEWGSSYHFTKKAWFKIVKEHGDEIAIRDQRIRHLEENCKLALRSLETAGKSLTEAQEEIARLKKALRVADEAVNMATDRGVY